MFNSLTALHLFFYFRLLAFLLLKVVNKITDGNPFKVKLSIFIEEQEATCVESLWKKATDHESLRTTGLVQSFDLCRFLTTATNFLWVQVW